MHGECILQLVARCSFALFKTIYKFLFSEIQITFQVDSDLMHCDIITFKHRASCILGQAFHYSSENAFYYLINKYISLSDICLTVHH